MLSETLETEKNSVFLKNMRNRSSLFQRNDHLEHLLAELSQLLSPVESEIEKQFNLPLLPPLLLVGNPRSGTTLFMQFLAATGNFAVPTNLLSRFYYAPYLGAKIQLLLADSRFNYKNELQDLTAGAEFKSSLGKTVGALAPSEFYHFWRRFLPNYDPEYLSEESCNLIDQDGLRKGVAAIEYVFGKPFAAKALILQYNIDLLLRIFEKSLIVYIERNPFFIMQSVFLAREDFYGDRDIWWSVKPKEYEMLRNMDIYHQIAGQTWFTKTSIENSFNSIPECNQLTIDYETLCANPLDVYRKIYDKYACLGISLTKEYIGPSLFTANREICLRNEDVDGLRNAYYHISGEKLAL